MFFTCYALAQPFTPDIENYPIEVYKADNQNWDVDVDDNGVVFVANNKGLLRYNGQSWKLFELPNKTIVRSVLCVKNRIYTGSYEEFGFWEVDDYGDYYYTSLMTHFEPNLKFDNEQFWEIIDYKGKIIFKSFAGGVYIYDGKKISYAENSFGAYDISVYNERVIIANRNNGLQEWTDAGVKPFQLKGNTYKITSVNNVAARDDLLFFYDLNQGAFLYNLEELVLLPEYLNRYLNKHVINKVTFLDSENLALGTIKDGLIIYNIRTKVIQHANKENGLINNTVLGLSFNKDKLWVALDNGLAKMDLYTSFMYYRDFSGVLGTVYDVVFHNDNFYIASNTGLYKLSNNDKLELIAESQGQVWDLSILNDQLIAGHNDGSFLIEQDIWADKIAESGVFCSVKIPLKENCFLQGTYYGISLIRDIDGLWESQSIENIPFLVNNIIFESKNTIWVTHPYKGLYRIKLNETFTKALEVKSYHDKQVFKQYQTSIHDIKDNVVIYNAGKWYKYFKEKDSIGNFKAFKKFNNNAIIDIEEDGIWFINRENNTLTYVDNNYNEIFNINQPELRKRLVAKYEKVETLSDSLRILNLNDGFAIFNINMLRNKHKEINEPVIEKIYSQQRTFLVDKNTSLEVPFYDAKNLTFEAFLPSDYSKNLNYTLTGRVNQEGVIRDGKIVLQNLPYGNYILTIKKLYINQAKGLDKIMKFKVLPPWYLSNIMKLIYFLIVIGAIYIYHKASVIKMRRNQIEAERSYIRENQRRIQKIEKQNLEKDILNKKRQLTNSTETIIKKNEVIILLRNELDRLLKVSPNKGRTKKLIDLSKNKKDADKEWKAFEANFNELHSDFFKRLITQYPKLTTKDLKLCAYIKTGLTSKEIAPLMGITTRGVEIHRYRLRKKIDIDSSNNISNFLKLF